MTDRAYIVSRTLENKIAIAENNNQNPILVTLEAMKEILALLKEQQQQIWELQDQVEYLTDKLKEQEHGRTFTVIDTKTGKEADEYEIALHEDWAKELCYCDMDGWAIMDDGTLLLVDECGRCAYADRERFKVVWDA